MAEFGKWEPICSCPKSEVLLYYPAITEGRNKKREWVTIGYNHSPRKASHWMPPPPAPTPEQP